MERRFTLGLRLEVMCKLKVGTAARKEKASEPTQVSGITQVKMFVGIS